MQYFCRSGAIAILAIVITFTLSSCANGGHSASIPLTSGRIDALGTTALASAGEDVIAINAGGSSVRGFTADANYTTAGTWTYATPQTVDTSAIAQPAPQNVYQTQRVGHAFAYTLSGLHSGARYTVRLSFDELWWTAAGQRVFSVTVNGQPALMNFDVFAASGGRFRAIVRSFTTTANAGGHIVIAFTASTDAADVNAIEIVSGSSSQAGTGLNINVAGGAVGTFSADEYGANPQTFTNTTTATIDTSGVSNPAPQAVYQSQRVGAVISYTIPHLTPGATYIVRLDFDEDYFTTARSRIFDIAINNVTVQSNLDVFAAAGGALKALATTFAATATSSGMIAINLTAKVNYAMLSGIEVTTEGGATPSPAPTFNDYPTYGYDNARKVFNPNSVPLTPATVGQLHLAWQSTLHDYNTQTQLILGTGVAGHAGLLFSGGASGTVYASDALSGALLWKRNLGQETYASPDCGSATSYFGIGGTTVYDAATKSIYVVGNSNRVLNAYASNALFHLDAATGQILGSVDFAPQQAGPGEINFSHTAIAVSDGIAYVGTGSTCDISSWRGRVAAIRVPAMTLFNTFFTVWDPNNTHGLGSTPWGGGGVWGWGGVAIDPNGYVLTGVGNADNDPTGDPIAPPFSPAPTEYGSLAETLLELTPGVGSIVAYNHPVPQSSYHGVSTDLDVEGTPLVFTPNGAACGSMVAIQGKSGELTFYEESQISHGSAAQYQLSPSTYEDGYLGDPAYSPVNGLVYAPIASRTSPTLLAPGLVAVNPGCGSPSIAWNASFGQDSSGAGVPRAVPAVSAGGVVLAGTATATGGALYAVDAATGNVLNGGSPVLTTSGHLRMPPTIDGDWVFVIDNNGNMYGLTTDPTYASIEAVHHVADSRQRTSWHEAEAR